MDLKEFQRRVAGEVERYLKAVAGERQAGNARHAARDAWARLIPGRYQERRNGLGEDLPSFAIQVPTGGGKTLLATQVLGSIYRTLLKERNGAGLALWVVPSSQIYRDTLKRLRDRNDLYRLFLEHALSRRLEVWEKHEVRRLSPARLRECLNILVLQLASTNRRTKEQLKFFRDSGGAIVEHFPPEDDAGGHRELTTRIPNLDRLEDDPAAGRHLVATSLANLVRRCAPPVILDEGHKATSRLARQTIEGFNASVVVELSATPQKGANVVSRVSGEELLREEMIKLPMNIATSGRRDWRDVLTRARDQREVLARKAAEHEGRLGSSRAIRPLVLVQVERTGKAERGKGFIHARDVEEFLVRRLAVPPEAIRVKTAEDDGLEDLELLAPGCPVEWIVTRSALQEGWDCPFAYILVSLLKTGSVRAMTQLAGRVLRQPYQERTPHAELNESYVYCLHGTAAEIARQVKAALEKEGYEGEGCSVVRDATRGRGRAGRRTAIRGEPAGPEDQASAARVYWPRFSIAEGGGHEALDYFEHLVREVDVDRFAYGEVDWELSAALRDPGNRFHRLTLNSDLVREHEEEAPSLESDEQVLAWLASSLRFDCLSHKQLARIIRRLHGRLVEHEPDLTGRLGLVKFLVRDRVEAFVEEGLDLQTEAAFGALLEAGKIKFHLECAGDRSHERAIALVPDRQADVLWWFRNRVGPQHFAVQGYRRGRERPGIRVRKEAVAAGFDEVLVIEGDQAGRRVTWKQLGAEFEDRVVRFQVLEAGDPTADPSRFQRLPRG